MFDGTEYEFFCSLFPHGKHDNRDLSISHVTMKDTPEGEILDSFDAGDRIYYLVKKDGCIATIRVCEAMEGSGYEAFVVLHETTMHQYRDNPIGIRDKFKQRKLVLRVKS